MDRAVQRNKVQYSTVQYCTVLYSAVSAVQSLEKQLDAAKAEVAAAQKAKQDAEKKLAPLKEQVQALLGRDARCPPRYRRTTVQYRMSSTIVQYLTVLFCTSSVRNPEEATWTLLVHKVQYCTDYVELI